MSFLETTIANLAKRLETHSETIQTEEAVKTSVILPFLQALGYDVFNPAEVIPEYTADAVGKRGEKVDYAIIREGEVAILIECKGLSAKLEQKHLSQLYRYFSVTNARFAILTNGREFQFYSDLEATNKLDRRPFFTFNLGDYSGQSLLELEKFARDSFDLDNILAQAERLKYVSSIKTTLADWFEDPPETLVKLVAAQVYDGRLNADVRGVIGSGIKGAFAELVRDRVRSRLKTALQDGPVEADQETVAKGADADIVTTQEEIEGWLIVKMALRGIVAGKRITMRDAKSYCAVLLDDNNRKPLARLHFNRAQKYIGLFDGDSEDKVAIGSLDEMLDLSDRIVGAAKKYG